MVPVPTLDARIDDLYKLPPDEFVSARTALAKTLSGDDARDVKALAKPTLVPWSVNQVYWHAHDVYGRLMKAGEKLRDAQLSALKGRHADVRAATTAHRQAVSDAVKAASRLASDAGAHPDPEPLARMFEALSLLQTPPESHGRFTRPLQPQGFEALAGVAIKVPAASERPRRNQHKHAEPTSTPASKPSAAEARELRRREHQATVARRRHEAAIKAAESRLTHAKSVETRARTEWDRAKKALDAAEKTLEQLRNHLPS